MKKEIYLIGRDPDASEVVNQSNIFKKYVLNDITDAKKNNLPLKECVNEKTLSNISKLNFCLCVDNIEKRKKIIKKKIYNFVSVISKSCSISKTSTFGNGLLAYNNSFIGSKVKIGKNCKINFNAKIHHNSSLGDNVVLGPNVTILSNVKIGDNVYVGANSIINNDVRIGKNILIGLGTKIIKNVKSNKKIYSYNKIKEIK